jgi:hypothetical protein
MEKKLVGGVTEQYLKPEMEVVELEKNDVIVTSCTGNAGGNEHGNDQEDP